MTTPAGTFTWGAPIDYLSVARDQCDGRAVEMTENWLHPAWADVVEHWAQAAGLRVLWEPWVVEAGDGIWQVRGIPSASFLQIFDALPEANREAGFNDAPTLEELAGVARRYPSARFGGSVVGPDGGTEGLSIEYLWVPADALGDDTVTEMRESADEDLAADGGRALWWD